MGDAARTLSDADWAELRALIREELERSAAKRKRRSGPVRSRSLRTAAALSATIQPSNDITRAMAKRALERLR